MAMNAAQRETLIEWMDDRDDPFTVSDVALFVGCHEMTARKYLTEFRDAGLIEKHPWRRGRADTWIRTDGTTSGSSGPRQSEMQRRAMRVVCGAEQLSVADWTCRNLGHAGIAACAHALLYAFTRSYYAGSSDHEHLRGPIPLVEVRAFVAKQYEALRRDMSVIEQLLQYRGPWEEGDEFAQRFGELPLNMTQVLERSHFYVQEIMGIGKEADPVIEVEKVKPPGDATVGDALDRLKGNVS